MITTSILICTRNRAEHLRQTLESFKNLEIPADERLEMIVVDNASTDHTPAVVEQAAVPGMEVIYLHEPKPGQSFARNSGMAAARGEIFLWTDDDVRLPPDWITAMCAPISAQKAVGVAGKIRMAPSLERPWMTRTHYDRLSDTRFMPDDFGSMIGANMAFHRRVFDEGLRFDTELGPGGLGFADDTLFSFQMREAKYGIVALPSVSVEHHFDASRLLRRNWLKNGEANGRSQAYMHHHWDGDDIKNARAKLAMWRLALRLFRLLRPPKSLDEEGCDRREIRIVQNISFIEQYLIECRRARKYPRQAPAASERKPEYAQ